MKLLLNRNELEKIIDMKKMRLGDIFATVYHLLHSDGRFRKNTKNARCRSSCAATFSKLLLNRLNFAKKITWVMIFVSIAFQRYNAGPIWAMLAEVQPSTGGSSSRTTQAVKLQTTQFHHNPSAKSVNERDSYLKRVFSC